MPDVNRVDLCGTVLQQAIGESASRCAHVKCGATGSVDFEKLQGVFELQPAAADEPIVSDQNKCVLVSNRFTRLAGGMIVDPNLAGHDGALGFLAALAQAALHQRHIHPFHRLVST